MKLHGIKTVVPGEGFSMYFTFGFDTGRTVRIWPTRTIELVYYYQTVAPI